MLELLAKPEYIAIIAALIGACAALFGQVIAGTIGIVKDVYLDRRKSKRSARYLALQLVLILDDFSGLCYGAAMNNIPEFNPQDDSEFRFRTETPDLKFPEGANWELLDPKLTDDVLWLENTLRNVHSAHGSLDVTPPDFDNLFEHRAQDYSKIGLTTLEIIEKLCRRYKIKRPERPRYYRPREGFEKKLEQMNGYFEAIEEQRQLQAEVYALEDERREAAKRERAALQKQELIKVFGGATTKAQEVAE